MLRVFIDYFTICLMSSCLQKYCFNIRTNDFIISSHSSVLAWNQERKHKGIFLVRAKSLQSCLTLCNPSTVASQAPLSMGFSRQEYWTGLHFLLQRIFPTQGLILHRLCLLHCQVGSLPLVPLLLNLMIKYLKNIFFKCISPMKCI